MRSNTLGLTSSHPPATFTPASQTSVTCAPLVPTEPLEHNDKTPASAAKGPPLSDDNEVRLTLGGTYRPGPGSFGGLGVEAEKRGSGSRKSTGLGSGGSDSVTLHEFDRVTSPSELLYKIGGDRWITQDP